MSTVNTVAKAAKQTKVVSVFDYLKTSTNLEKALPKHISKDRFVAIMINAVKGNPELMKKDINQGSLIGAVVQAVQLGLEVGSLGYCHFVPFNNKGRGKEVTFIMGYRGYVELVNRSGRAAILNAEVVYEGDAFDCQQGLNPILKHIPANQEDRGEVKGVYAVAKNLIANEKVFVYLSKADIDKVRASAKASSSEYSPWSKWYEEMAKKTAVKRLVKLLPLSVETQRQIMTDETTKDGIQEDMTQMKDVTNWDQEPQEEPVDTTGAIVDDETMEGE